jgi:hypothetical protein
VVKRRMATDWIGRTTVGVLASGAFAVVGAAQTHDDHARAEALTTCINQVLQATPGVITGEPVETVIIGTYASGAYHPGVSYSYRDRTGRERSGTGSVTGTGDVLFYFDPDSTDVYDGPLGDEFVQALGEKCRLRALILRDRDSVLRLLRLPPSK